MSTVNRASNQTKHLSGSQNKYLSQLSCACISYIIGRCGPVNSTNETTVFSDRDLFYAAKTTSLPLTDGTIDAAGSYGMPGRAIPPDPQSAHVPLLLLPPVSRPPHDPALSPAMQATPACDMSRSTE